MHRLMFKFYQTLHNVERASTGTVTLKDGTVLAGKERGSHSVT